MSFSFILVINMGPDLVFYFSYLDDNPQKIAIFQSNGSVQRIPFLEENGRTNYFSDGSDKISSMPFDMPRAAQQFGLFYRVVQFAMSSLNIVE